MASGFSEKIKNTGRPQSFFADGLLPLAAVLILVFLLVLLFLSGIGLVLLVVHGVDPPK